jgi:hypothetical protein
MADTPTVLKAQMYALAIQRITGEKPVIIYYEDRAEINFTKSQAEKIRAMMVSKKPPDVKINLMPVLFPLILQKAIIYTLVTLITGIIIGKVK